jgi:Acyclic terpene utilisation family protein AtuA
MAKVFIGAAAGFAGDRSDAGGPVVDALAAHSGPRFLMFETLAERTLALCQLERRQNPQRGYSPALERLLSPVLARCLASGIRIVSNFGAANPAAAAHRIAGMANSLGLRAPRIATVEGDDITAKLSAAELAVREIGGASLAQSRDIISANLYLGAQPIAEALNQGADIVVTGRVADSALALGPLLHAFRWRADDWDRLAAGTLAGHLLECGAQITGGYFADPGYKDVPDLAEVGYPIAEIDEAGEIVISLPNLKVRVDAVGVRSVLGASDSPPDLRGAQANDIRLRFAAQSADSAQIEMLLDEVEALYCAGPAGGAGVRRRTTPRLASASCLIERRYAEPRVTMLGGPA